MMGMSSLAAMDMPCERWSHRSWNHEVWCQAPAPQEPEVSVASSTIGRWEGGERKEMPFQWGRKVCHQARSERKALLRRMGELPWWVSCWEWSKSIILRRKDRPIEPPCTHDLVNWLKIPAPYEYTPCGLPSVVKELVAIAGCPLVVWVRPSLCQSWSLRRSGMWWDHWSCGPLLGCLISHTPERGASICVNLALNRVEQ